MINPVAHICFHLLTHGESEKADEILSEMIKLASVPGVGGGRSTWIKASLPHTAILLAPLDSEQGWSPSHSVGPVQIHRFTGYW